MSDQQTTPQENSNGVVPAPVADPEVEAPEFQEVAVPEIRPEDVPDVQVEMYEGEFNPEMVRMMVYSDSGVGKSVFGSWWPSPVYLDMDKGMSSIRRRVGRIAINTWEDLQSATVYLAYGKHNFKTVIVDTLNEVQKLSMSATVTNFPSVRRSYGSLPGMSDYGKMLYDFDNFMRFMRGLSMNVVFICQTERREIETDPIRPQLTGKATVENIARMMDIIGYLARTREQGDTQSRIMYFDSAEFLTKDRSDVLPAQVMLPHGENAHQILYKYWTGKAR